VPLIQAVLDCAARYKFTYVCMYVCKTSYSGFWKITDIYQFLKQVQHINNTKQGTLKQVQQT